MIARLEGEVLLAALARAYESIEPAGEPHFRLNNVVRSYRNIPLHMTPAH
jgi:cytochrome P450